jgi:hypothetical protein
MGIGDEARRLDGAHPCEHLKKGGHVGEVPLALCPQIGNFSANKYSNSLNMTSLNFETKKIFNKFSPLQSI